MRPFRIFCWALAGIALLSLLILTPGTPVSAIPPLAFIFFPAALVLQYLSFRISSGIYHSFEGAVCLACALLFGPVPAAWVAGLSAAVNEAISRRRGREFLARSGGMFALMWLAGGYAYQAAGGRVPLRSLGSVQIGQILLLFLVVAAVNRLLMALDHWLQNLSARHYLTRVAPWTFLVELAMMPGGAAMAVAYVLVSPVALLLLLFPLLVVGYLARRLDLAQQTLERQVTALDALNRAGRFIGSSLDPEPLLALLREGIGQLIDTSTFWIVLYDEERGELAYEVFYDEGVPYPPMRRPYEPGGGIAAWLIENRKPLLAGSLEEMQSLGIPLVTAGSGKPPESILGVPMMAKGKVIGAICSQSYKRNAFTQEEQEVLMTLANQAAIAFENARLFQEVEQGREYLRTVLDSVDYAIIVTDLDGRVRLVNRMTQRVLNVSEEEAIGRPADELATHEAIRDAIRQMLEGNGPRARAVEVKLSDGRVMVAHRTSVVNRQGDRWGYVIAMADVTPLHQLSELKSRMIQMASHDLRNPLHLAGGFFQILLEDLPPLSEHQARLASRVLKNLETMERLIDNLLELERVEAAQTVRQEPVDLGDLAREVVQDLRLQAEMKAQRVWTETGRGPLLVRGDRRMLTQVIVNLLDNAIKYTPAGGEILVRVWAENGEVLLTVKDTGVGIPPEALPHVFEQFYRARQPGTEHVAGTGLGLSLVQSVVREHGGRVWVDSEGVVGKGSTFGIALPALSGPPVVE